MPKYMTKVEKSALLSKLERMSVADLDSATSNLDELLCIVTRYHEYRNRTEQGLSVDDYDGEPSEMAEEIHYFGAEVSKFLDQIT